MTALARLMNPSSIALIGASPDPSKLAARPLRYLQRYGYKGRVYPVNPKHAQIDGVTCCSSVSALPRDVDLALILLPAAGVADALEQCAERGVASAISIAGGFAEAGEAQAQDRLSDICRHTGIRLIGPNCVGLLRPSQGVTATFSSELRNTMPRPGRIALFTQSGALGNAMLQSFNDLDIGLAYWVSTGNEADVGLLDLLAHALDDPDVDMVAMYVEGLKQGDRLLELARKARAAGKVVIVLRAGKSQLGRAAAISHTGKLAGAWKVWNDVASQAGLINVDSLDDLLDVALLHDRYGSPTGLSAQGLGVLTVSGGMGVLISDAAAQAGLEIPAFSAQTQARLRSVLPEQMSVANPVDTALFTNEKGYGICAEAVLHDEGIGVLLLVLTRLAHDYTALLPWLEQLTAQAMSRGKRLAVSYLSSSDPLVPEDRRRLTQAGALVPMPHRSHHARARGGCDGALAARCTTARIAGPADSRGRQHRHRRFPAPGPCAPGA